MGAVSLDRHLAKAVAPAFRESPPAKDRVSYGMTCRQRYIVQAIAYRVEKGIYNRAHSGSVDVLDRSVSISSGKRSVNATALSLKCG